MKDTHYYAAYIKVGKRWDYCLRTVSGEYETIAALFFAAFLFVHTVKNV